MSTSRASRLAPGLAGAGVLLVLLGAGPAFATPKNPDGEHKVTICHATASDTNPYVENTVDVASILGDHGHDGHTGPVWYEDHPKHWDWGDIIPAFDFGPGEQYGGMNTVDGATFLGNHCNLPATSTTSTTVDGGGGSTTTSAPEVTTTSTTQLPSTTTSTTAPEVTTTTEPPTTSTTAEVTTTTQPEVTTTTEPPTTSTTAAVTTTTESEVTTTTEPPTTSTTVDDAGGSTTSTTEAVTTTTAGGEPTTTQVTAIDPAHGSSTSVGSDPTVIEDASSGLPRTGIESNLLVALGAALLLASIGALGLSRRLNAS